MSNMSPNDLLGDWLTTHSPNSILHLGGATPPALSGYQQHSSCRMLQVEDHRRIDLSEAVPDTVVISDYLENLSLEDGEKLLADLRNHLIPHVLIFFDHSRQTGWNFSKLIALGFKRLMAFEHSDRQLCCYSYDIDSYNPRRTWNTPENWANPENFGKYWW